MAKNLELTKFMFKSMECCPNAYNIGCVNGTSALQYQHQWELEQKKAEDTEAPKFDKNNWAKTMKSIVLHLKLIRGVSGTLLDYEVQHHDKVALISPQYYAYLNLDEEILPELPSLM